MNEQIGFTFGKVKLPAHDPPSGVVEIATESPPADRYGRRDSGLAPRTEYCRGSRSSVGAVFVGTVKEGPAEQVTSIAVVEVVPAKALPVRKRQTRPPPTL